MAEPNKQKAVGTDALAIFKREMETVIDTKIAAAGTEGADFATEQDILALFQEDGEEETGVEP